jgi:hypothetical protein
MIGCGFLVATGWNFILRSIGGKIPYPRLLRIFFFSELGKYIPGKIWAVMGRIMLSKKEGVPKLVTAASVGTQLIIQVISGMLIVLVTLPFWPALELPGRFYLIFLFIPVGLLGLHPRIFNPVLSWVLKKFEKVTLEIKLKYSRILLIVFSWGFLWMVKGAATFVLIKALYHSPLNCGAAELPNLTALLITIGLVTLSWVAGTLSFVAPAGFGVTEALVVLLLGSLFSIEAGIATAIALFDRVWGIIAELLSLLIILALGSVFSGKIKDSRGTINKQPIRG